MSSGLIDRRTARLSLGLTAAGALMLMAGLVLWAVSALGRVIPRSAVTGTWLATVALLAAGACCALLVIAILITAGGGPVTSEQVGLPGYQPPPQAGPGPGRHPSGNYLGDGYPQSDGYAAAYERAAYSSAPYPAAGGYAPPGDPAGQAYPLVGEPPGVGFPVVGEPPGKAYPPAGRQPGEPYPLAGRQPGEPYPSAGRQPGQSYPVTGPPPGEAYPLAGPPPVGAAPGAEPLPALGGRIPGLPAEADDAGQPAGAHGLERERPTGGDQPGGAPAGPVQRAPADSGFDVWTPAPKPSAAGTPPGPETSIAAEVPEVTETAEAPETPSAAIVLETSSAAILPGLPSGEAPPGDAPPGPSPGEAGKPPVWRRAVRRLGGTRPHDADEDWLRSLRSPQAQPPPGSHPGRGTPAD